MKKMTKMAAFVAMVLTAGFASCQEKIPDYLIVDGTVLTGYTDGIPANLVIPKGITKIAGGAFVGCNRLESVTIPGSVTAIGEDITVEEFYEKGMDDKDLCVFYNCGSLMDVTIEKGVKTIGLSAFGFCNRFALTYKGSLKDWCAVDWDSSIFLNAMRIALSDGTDPRELTKITASDLTGVTKIGKNAFKDCYSLASITIPNSVKTIGENAFAGCESLTSVTIPNSVTTIGEYAFEDCESLTTVTIQKGIKEIGEYAFIDCESLTSVEIPNTVTKIGEKAFYGCESLTSVTIPNSVKTIGEEAFYGCESLASVSIPSSVTEIGDNAFDNCESLKSVQYGGTKKQWEAIDGDEYDSNLPGGVTISCTDGNIRLKTSAEIYEETARTLRRLSR